MPALGGSLVLLLALPVFLVAGWPLEGWGLAAVLWVAVHAIDLFLQQRHRVIRMLQVRNEIGRCTTNIRVMFGYLMIDLSKSIMTG